MSVTVTFNDNMIDSRDLIKYMRENEKELTELDMWEDYVEFAEEFAGAASCYEIGCTAISESYFEEFAEDYVMGMMEAPDFVLYHIDWRGIANELKEDYTEISFSGNSYFVR